jgi:tetratricopeptide (TPR) repeat protein
METKNIILEALKRHGKSGSYREALKDYLSNNKNNSLDDHLIDIQFAVALQHAGLYNLALETYLEVEESCKQKPALFKKANITLEDLLYNLTLQEAVLRERLQEVDAAIKILDRIKKPKGVTDIEIAHATIESWYYITRFKCHMFNKQYDLVSKYIKECNSTKDVLLRCWIDIFEILVDVNKKKKFSKLSREKLEKEIEQIGEVDIPGQPWLYLMVGEYLAELFPKEAIPFLEKASKTASVLGKYYIIASSSEILAKCYKDDSKLKHLFEITLCRSINSYAKCHLLLRNPFRHRLYKLAMSSKRWKDTDFLNLFISSAGFARDRNEIKFYEMCAQKAQQEKKKGFQVFEEFVSDWASLRFFGERLSEPAGQPTADTIIVREIDGKRIGTIVQAKHYKNPKQSIPTNLQLHDIAVKHKIDKIEKYVFVVSTSNKKGWDKNSWHYEDEKKIRNLIPDISIELMIMTEPELQTDVILNDQLFFKYFNYLLPSID